MRDALDVRYRSGKWDVRSGMWDVHLPKRLSPGDLGWRTTQYFRAQKN